MSNYIDSIVIPVPRANLGTYKRMSEEWGEAHLRHGALYMLQEWADMVDAWIDGRTHVPKLLSENVVVPVLSAAL